MVGDAVAVISSSILAMMTCHFYFTFSWAAQIGVDIFIIVDCVLRMGFAVYLHMCGRCLTTTATDVAVDGQRRHTHTHDTKHNNNRRRRRHTFHVDFEYIAVLASISCKRIFSWSRREPTADTMLHLIPAECRMHKSIASMNEIHAIKPYTQRTHSNGAIGREHRSDERMNATKKIASNERNGPAGNCLCW